MLSEIGYSPLRGSQVRDQCFSLWGPSNEDQRSSFQLAVISEISNKFNGQPRGGSKMNTLTHTFVLLLLWNTVKPWQLFSVASSLWSIFPIVQLYVCILSAQRHGRKEEGEKWTGLGCSLVEESLLSSYKLLSYKQYKWKIN